jgi:serine/threonine-protein kinase
MKTAFAVALAVTAAVSFAPPAGAEVTLNPDSNNSVWVQTESGKTVCQVRTDSVACAATWQVPTQGNVATVSSNGQLVWGSGDTGPVSPTTLIYGTTYSAVGWSINPTNMGTRFTNGSTGHGMAVGLQGATAF